MGFAKMGQGFSEVPLQRRSAIIGQIMKEKGATLMGVSGTKPELYRVSTRSQLFVVTFAFLAVVISPLGYAPYLWTALLYQFNALHCIDSVKCDDRWDDGWTKGSKARSRCKKGEKGAR
tara:strand:+ start:1227 stop:1583 length:357 start_codon:yes stop_codon:yes gene_type:complete